MMHNIIIIAITLQDCTLYSFSCCDLGCVRQGWFSDTKTSTVIDNEE